MISMIFADSVPSPVRLILHFPARSMMGSSFWTTATADVAVLLFSPWFAAWLSSEPSRSLIPVEDSMAASNRGSARKSVLSRTTHLPQPAQAGLANMIKIMARLRIDFILNCIPPQAAARLAVAFPLPMTSSPE